VPADAMPACNAAHPSTTISLNLIDRNVIGHAP
jgi:hypothetical protein